MKYARRLSLFLSLLILMIFSTSGPHQAAPAPPEKIIDPACVAVCTLLMQDCFRSEKPKGCLGIYHHCVAQCGKG